MKQHTILALILSSLFYLICLLTLLQEPTTGLAQINDSNTALAAAPRWSAQAAAQQTIPPAIVVTKTASITLVLPGERLTYTVQVRNATTMALRIQLTDTLPSALISVTTPTATQGIPVHSDQLITWTGVVSAAQQVVIRYSAIVTPGNDSRPITNAVRVGVNASEWFTTTAAVVARRRLFMPVVQRSQPPPPPTLTPTPTPPVPTLVNGNFEAGPHVGWTETSSHFDALIVTGSRLPNPVTPHSPVYVAWLGGRDNERADLAQSVAIPAGYPTLRLRYHYWGASLDTGCAGNSDVAYIKVNNTIRRTFLLCKSNDTNGWQEAFLDVTTYANQRVTLHFTLQLDSVQNSNFFLDDVSFCVNCGP